MKIKHVEIFVTVQKVRQYVSETSSEILFVLLPGHWGGGWGGPLKIHQYGSLQLPFLALPYSTLLQINFKSIDRQ
jgi:hypothetical protein